MNRDQIRLALLKITAIALCLSTWVFWSFVFATRPAESEETTLTHLVRLPASLPSQIPALQRKPAPIVTEMKTLTLDCLNQLHGDEAVRTVSARYVRLSGTTCGAKNPGDVTVVNARNAYSATVFALSRGLTTDFIPLEAGRNDLRIRFAPGHELHLAILRE